MTTFVWKNEYSTGIKDIDEQHKKLSDFALQLGEIADQANIDSRKARRKTVLLGAYARAHFAYLEEWMLKNGYYLSGQDKNIDRTSDARRLGKKEKQKIVSSNLTTHTGTNASE